MRIITDNGIDIDPKRITGLPIHVVPLVINFDEKVYRGGVDIQSDEFYRMLKNHPDKFPTTSQPAPGDFQTVYTEQAKFDAEMISIHISAELSGTYNSARLASELVKDQGINVTVIDSKLVSGAEAWLVEAAARAAHVGASRGEIISLVNRLAQHIRLVFSPETLKYLVHGGRVSHLKGFAASLLNIKPLIQLKYETGKLDQLGTVRTMKKALAQQVEQIHKELGDQRTRIQIIHADNPQGATEVQGMLSQRLDCHFMPSTNVTPLVGAHTGPGVVGIVYAKESLFDGLPS